MGPANYTYETAAADPFFGRGEKVTNLTDEEALSLVQLRGNMTNDGSNPTLRPLHRLWFECQRFYIGLQSRMSAGVDTMFSALLATGDGGYVANHILRMVMAEVARLSASPPDADVIPDTPDIEDQFAAQVAGHFLKYAEKKYQLRAARREKNYIRSIVGTAFLRTDWNERAGGKIETFQNPFDQSLLKGDQIPEEQKKWLRKNAAVQTSFEGDFEIDVLHPMNLVVPQGHLTLDKMPWLLTFDDRTIEWVWTNYPEVAKDVRPDDTNASVDANYWRQLQTLIGRSAGFTGAQPGPHDDIVRVGTLWIPPSGFCPTGFKIIATKNVLLDKLKHPFHEKGLDIKYPLTRCRRAEVPGAFWGTGLVEHLMAPQQDYNRARRQIMDHRDLLGRPVWLSPQNAELTLTKMSLGDLLEYRSGVGKPELQNPPAMSQTHLDTLERAIYDMQIISAQSDVSQAQVPTGVRSGVAIQSLAEKDTSVMRVMVEEGEECMEEAYRKILLIAWKFMETPRMIQIYGEFRQADIAIFKGADLRGQAGVRIKTGSMMPRNKAETYEEISGMMERGALDPINNRQHNMFIWEALDIGGADKMFFREAGHRRRARIENQMFLKPQVDPATGMPQPFPDINENDDHEAHIEEHDSFRITDAYEMLPPIRKMIFEAHDAKHKAALAALMQAQMAMQASAAGPGGGGGGSAPKEPGKASQPAKRGETPGTFKPSDKG